ncbi:hypothetical protein SADUNF_Sadunf18G0022100 [Salix dunnii]|uniref:BSD2 cysteine rich domain-containing protein n=1 Tax=Salix dunnii TaxID=1413687 RepID=A0A835J505_9ROSI|nr:hypothetical protein SADUNF_Sadunf18G0022100 [Salix dunnii]
MSGILTLTQLSSLAMASCSQFVLPIRVKQQDSGIHGTISGVQEISVPGVLEFFHNSSVARRCCVRVKAAPSNQNTKPNSMICADCDGNGAVLCSQCKGSGVNSADLFNGRFKAGDSCWLCGGRKEMLCGNCNGAGFIGGFMSTFDE